MSNRLPSRVAFKPTRPGAGNKRSSTAPQPSGSRPPASQASRPSQHAGPSSSQPVADEPSLPDGTLVPPGISQVIDARLLDNGPGTQDTLGLSQSATQVDTFPPGLRKSTCTSTSPDVSKIVLPTIDAIDSRLLDDAAPAEASREKENAQPGKRATRTTKSPEIPKRPAGAPLHTAEMLPPTSSSRPKAKSALLQAAATTEGGTTVYHRGKRAGSRTSSRAGSRGITQSPAPGAEAPPDDFSNLLPTETNAEVEPEPIPAPAEAPIAAPKATRKPHAKKRNDDAGMPPSLGAASGSGLPPTLGTSQAPPSPAAEATLASAAAAQEAGGEASQATKRSAPRIRRTRKAGTSSQAPRPRKVRAEPPPAPTEDDDEMVIDPSLEAGPSQPAARVSQPRRIARPPAKRQRVVREDSRSEGVSQADAEGGDEEEEDSLAGMTRKKKKRNPNYIAGYEAGEAQPGEMLGVDIDADSAKLKDLLGDLGTDGRVSERGILVAGWKKEKYQEKLRAREVANEEAWRQKQVLRRQARALRNAAKERLREEARERGEGSDGVDRDSEDSEEEFEHVPKRLTPSVSPVPGEEDGVAQEGDAVAEEGEAGEEEEVEEPLFLPRDSEAPEGEEQDDAPPEDEDPEMAALRAAGFTIRAEGEADLDDDEEIGDYDPEQMSFDEYQALMERHEASRRARLEAAQAREVVEEDRVQMVNSASFSKKKRSRNEKWTDEETDFFYHVLGEVGENYGLMAHYFPGRNMVQLKRKGRRENKADAARVTAAINSRKRMDVTYLRKTVAYDTDAPMDKERQFIQEVIAESDRIKKEDSVASRHNGVPAGEVVVEGQEEDEEEVEGDLGDEDEGEEEEVDEEMVEA